MKKYLIIVFLVVHTHLFVCAQTAKIKVTVTGIENTKGFIYIGLYNTKESFPKIDLRYKGICSDPNTNGTTQTFENISAGKYAVGAFHDENKDLKLDRNKLGIPTEKYGFSNNVFETFGPPKFEDASFTIKDGQTVNINIVLK